MKALKYILFVLFILILLSEQLLNLRPVLLVKPLSGVVVPVEKPQFLLDDWLKGEYQNESMKYLEENLLLHPFLIRLRNQVAYSFFNEITNKDIIEGKNHMLFGTPWVIDYLGKDFVGEKEVQNKVEKLSFVQTELKKRNIDLVFIIAPSKAVYFQEYLPEKELLSKRPQNNYSEYVKQFKKNKINYLDFTEIFKQMKAHSKHPLFTKCGVHWSGYGATIAADTTFSYLEKLSSACVPDFYDAGGEETVVPRGTDADISDLMNLLVDVPSDKMYYPKIVFKNNCTKKPNLLIVGDSFSWSWITTFSPFIQNEFSSESSFWYYNHEIGWSASGKGGTLTKDLDLKEQTLHRDVIFIVNNELALYNAGQNFIEQMYDLLKTENISEFVGDQKK